MQAPLYDGSGDAIGHRELPEYVFGIEPNRAVMHQALVRQMANARQGTHSTLHRGEVNRTRKKLYRQKGTGGARHGDRKSPVFVGGGKVHTPKPRDYSVRMPRQMRRLALRSALSAKAQADAITLVDAFRIDAPKTKDMARLLDKLTGGASTLVVLAGRDESVERSVRNLGHVKYLHAGYLNIRDLLGFDRLVLPLSALDAVVAHLDDTRITAGGEGDDASL